MSKKAVLFLNGDAPAADTLQQIACEVLAGRVFAVCADGAYDYVKNYLLPHTIIGDFDSCKNCAVPDGIEVLRLCPEKDFTDGHTAMQYIIDNGAAEVEIYGAGGGRADHALSNYSLLALAASNNVAAKMDIEDFWVVLARGDFSASVQTGKIVSLVPYSDKVHILFTRGLKYPIADRTLDKIHILGISNIATQSQIEYKITHGTALVFLQK